MSLMQRVQDARDRGDTPAHSLQTQLVDALKAYVQERISSTRIAELMTDNVQRARNEIRSICLEGFDEGRIAVVLSSEDERQEAIESLLDAMFGFGPLEALLEDETVTEIMVNGSRSLYFERGGVLQRASSSLGDDASVRALIDRIIGPLGRRIDESSPMVNARLPQGHRVHAIIPPLALDGPVLTIRKFTEKVLRLEEMEEIGSIEPALSLFLRWLVAARSNIAVSGGTGTGKTTMLNALSCEISPQERIITIEDSAELRFLEHPHVVRLEARPRNAEGSGLVTIRDLVINALRMRPDRIIVGECRGDEAIDMLQAMSTGHDGSLTTLHANSSADVIMRLTTMVRFGAELPVDVIEAQIASALDHIVQINRDAAGHRFVSELVELNVGSEGRGFSLKRLYRREFFDEAGRWEHKPRILESLPRKEVAQAEEVDRWLDQTALR